MSVLTADLVLGYMASDGSAAAPFQLHYEFTPAQVEMAFRLCAMEFNGILPFSMKADPACLSAETNAFLDGVAAHLYAIELRYLTRKDFDYTAGGVTTNLVKARIGHLQRLITDHRERFLLAAKALKITRNLDAAWGHH